MDSRGPYTCLPCRQSDPELRLRLVLTEQIKQYKNAKKRVASNEEQNQAVIKRLKAENGRLKDDISELKEENCGLTKENIGFKDEISKLKDENSGLKEDFVI